MVNTTIQLIQARATPDYTSLLKPPIVAQLYSWGYLVLFILGFTGNTASLFTFTRPTLRSVSTGTLFIILAISDTVFLLISIIDFIDFGLQIPLYTLVNYDILCRFRLFIISMSQICSAWILVLISIDRWIRTRFPYKSTAICTQEKAILAVAIVIILDIGLHAVMLTPLIGTLLPGVALIACAPVTTNYLIFYYTVWSILQVFINCLLPVMLMLFFLIDMFIKIRLQKQALTQQTEVRIRSQNQGNKRNHRLQTQLFGLMLSSIIIFLMTTLPVAIYRIIFPRQILSVPLAQFPSIASISACLTWFWGFNYAVNFYVHCLTSTLFRKEFKRSLYLLCGTRQITVTPMTVVTVR